MTVFVCDNTFEGVLSAVYDAWASRIKHTDLSILVGPIGQRELFADYRMVEENSEKATSVMQSIQKKISWQAWHQCMYCALSAKKDRPDVIYRFLLLGFTVGAGITKCLREPAVMKLFEYSRAVGNESHYYREFLRFHKHGNIYISFITPRCEVLPYVGEHFSDRMPSEHFMIIDDRRRMALIHPSDKDFYLRKLTEEEYEQLKSYEKQKDEIADLWTLFFHTISIKERENPTCQRNHLPLYYRKHMTEFLR